VKKDEARGSGLKSTVMWDPYSGVKFANNEPWRPFFKASQINIFNEEHKGDGIQHVALTVRDILSAVRAMRERGVAFMPTPGTYYDAAARAHREARHREDRRGHRALRELQILVDGDKKSSYLLQIFLKEASGLYQSKDAGPFFYEIIQRKGDKGFGAGNFRALFESIERAAARGGQGLMLDRMSVGELPKKHHIALRGEGGELRHEECITRRGFDGPYTIVYHLRRPHTARALEMSPGSRSPRPWASARCASAITSRRRSTHRAASSRRAGRCSSTATWSSR
jgi:hypothetical protein